MSQSFRKSEWEKANQQTDRTLSNLTEELAMGNRSAAIRSRLEELESEERKMKNEVLTLDSTAQPRFSPSDLSKSVAAFILNFDEVFERAPMAEKKFLIQKCISEIVVDREAHVARLGSSASPRQPSNERISANKKGTHKSCEYPE